jgi:transitional endoplasmic reticulum ATPase
VDEDALQSIAAKAGDIVEIQVKKKVLARAMPFHPYDPHMRTSWEVGMDEDTMNNVGAMIGGEAVIRRTSNVPIAKEMTLLSLDSVPKGTSPYIRRGMYGLPFTAGDKITIPVFAKRLLFKVAGIVPIRKSSDYPSAAVVTKNTVLVVKTNTSEHPFAIQ